MFIETNKTIDEYKIGLHQNYLATFLVIHDEFDLLVDRFMVDALSAKIADILENRKIFGKLGYSFVRFKFDVEYDEWGSFTPQKTLNAIEYALKKYEVYDDKTFNKIILEEDIPVTIEKIPEPEPTPERDIIRVVLTGIQPENLEGVLKSISELKGNDAEIFLEYNGVQYNKPDEYLSSDDLINYCLEQDIEFHKITAN